MEDVYKNLCLTIICRYYKLNLIMEDSLALIAPDISYKSQYKKMVKRWRKHDAEILPWFIKENLKSFNQTVEKLNNYSKGIDVPDGFVPSTTYWIKSDKKLIGAVNIRHKTNDMILKYFGQIGYAIEPCERHKNYATKALKIALLECKNLKMKRVLICCDKKNLFSAKTILNNNGVLENEILDINNDKIIQRYWIDIT